MSGGKRFFLMLVTFLGAIFLILALNNVDVEAVPGYTKVGFSGLNMSFRNLWHYDESCGYSVFWFNLSRILGLLSLAVCAFWTGLFCREVIKSGGFDGVGVDKNLMATFWLYVFAAALCLIFRKCAVSYCPVKLDGSKKLVSSFPSAYAMLFIVAMGSTIFHVWDLVAERKKLAVILTVLCSLLMLLGIFARMICGMNWLTDIIGGILMGSNLILLYSFFFCI